MKKVYQAPLVTIVKVSTDNFICTSLDTSTATQSTGGRSADSRSSFWEDED